MKHFEQNYLQLCMFSIDKKSFLNQQLLSNWQLVNSFFKNPIIIKKKVIFFLKPCKYLESDKTADNENLALGSREKKIPSTIKYYHSDFCPKVTLKIRFENYQSVLSIFCAEQCSCILLRFSLFLRTTPFNIACLHAGCLSLSWCRLFAPREHARHASLEVLAPKVTGEKLSLQVCKGLSPSCH